MLYASYEAKINRLSLIEQGINPDQFSISQLETLRLEDLIRLGSGSKDKVIKVEETDVSEDVVDVSTSPREIRSKGLFNAFGITTASIEEVESTLSLEAKKLIKDVVEFLKTATVVAIGSKEVSNFFNVEISINGRPDGVALASIGKQLTEKWEVIKSQTPPEVIQEAIDGFLKVMMAQTQDIEVIKECLQKPEVQPYLQVVGLTSLSVQEETVEEYVVDTDDMDDEELTQATSEVATPATPMELLSQETEVNVSPAEEVIEEVESVSDAARMFSEESEMSIEEMKEFIAQMQRELSKKIKAEKKAKSEVVQ